MGADAKQSIDWSRFDAMTDQERTAAALADPDNPPLTDGDLKRMKPVPQVRIIRRRLKLSQEAFSARFGIPVGTLRDWEQGRKVPDAATRAYLTVIARDPEAVARALEQPPRSAPPAASSDRRTSAGASAPPDRIPARR